MSRTTTVYTLANGLRVLCWPCDSLVSYIGVSVNAGSRDEDETCHGLAHFVEHTVFKGTDKRKVWQISDRMESVGGDLNAYTSKEDTMVYTGAPAGYEERAVELLADILSSSRFPKEEIDRERGVVIEEIKRYLDSPSETVVDRFEDLAYKGSGLAHNILGTPDSVERLGSDDCRRFLDRFYTPGNMVLYCSSPIQPEKFLRLAEKYFGCMHFPFTPHDRILPPPMEPFSMTEDFGSHQANTIIGARIMGRNDPRRFALYLLNNYLGGAGMNSRLNRELREKRGFVYAVDSFTNLMTDTGLLMVYFGSDPSKVDKCKKIIFNELDRLAQSPISGVTFEKMKRQYCGQLIVSSDRREGRVMSMAKTLLFSGEVRDISDTAECIRAVTPEEVRRVAEMVAPSRCSMLTLI
ncbi:MAG: insulinase family protein [Muribaculaceae bacterium]|nr:insulinase family protein [Muribaculaceae bacterium]